MRKYRRFFPLGLGILLVAGVALWGYGQMAARQAAETALTNKYNLAFYNLMNNVQNMEVILSKSLVGQETKQDAQLFMGLWQESLAAQSNLGQIPVTEASVARTIKFLNQVGAYSQSLATQTAGGASKSDDQWQTLNKLYKQAQTLNGELRDVEANLSSGNLTLSELRRDSRYVLRRAGPQLANSNFQVIDRNMQQFPTLIYDGPFSDHIVKKTPVGLEGAQVSGDQARDIALKFIGSRPDTTYIASVAGTVNGRIPVHRVDITPRPAQNGERISMGVSSRGGKVVWMLNSRSPGAAALSVREAGDIAGSFLEDRGFKEMESTYYEVRDNLAVYNYAATQGKVILYPDQIKVTVSLDNGQVVGFDAANYWMAHNERKLPQAKLSVTQAREKLSPKLEDVTPGRLALIPKTVDSEVLTYEFQGRLEKDVFLVYIDALTGEEVKLLKVIKTNSGVLTM
ncbi:MAG: hypothetical protein JL50_01630 [Peptococcaceae bacterium BICA1-7]|nr:MAG: hypothetical protein JL50_01630 [Peptococcaceae bacterium BICA1-7]